ncbi:unnamed protein product [Didymodactylos carnosus]|uniref:Uncharacterized protein n=1 Tax=Didymodactylos carnosus TaxID=1234261 RepID=A0A814MNM8_9BILA|nr:unnamed protein product [Didymodactylos carnosus]CAF1542840.1 unnamed protein product [Didymodactylos carnosus]CAF3847616.1 unnamed protein product [Didymodactylos carnosus]CAF4331428.1 unnamed protein product [Didymodactylos carnosus]
MKLVTFFIHIILCSILVAQNQNVHGADGKQSADRQQKRAFSQQAGIVQQQPALDQRMHRIEIQVKDTQVRLDYLEKLVESIMNINGIPPTADENRPTESTSNSSVLPNELKANIDASRQSSNNNETVAGPQEGGTNNTQSGGN